MTKDVSIGVFALAIILVVAGIYFFFGLKKPGEYARATVVLGGAEFRVDIADTLAKQTQGLSGRAALGEREGMLFVFATSSPRFFWMKDMAFPIDLLWLRDDTVIGVEEHMVPEPGKNALQLKLYPSPGLANRVLEIADGTIARLGVKAGDKVVVE